MFKKIFIISIVISTTIIVSGCAGKNETLLYFESYNKLENSPGKSVGGVFTFEVNGQRFEVMDGYTAEHLEIIKEDYNNKCNCSEPPLIKNDIWVS